MGGFRDRQDSKPQGDLDRAKFTCFESIDGITREVLKRHALARTVGRCSPTRGCVRTLAGAECADADSVR